MDATPGAMSLAIDYGRAAADYGAHRQGFPPEFFARLRALGVGRQGQAVLDLGTGTGLLAREFARRGCRVTGLDASPAMLAEAEAANAAEVISVHYRLGRAEATGLPDASFDVVSAGTCWHWFDRAAAAGQARRVLKPDGRLVIANLDWHDRPGTLVGETLALIDAHAEIPPADHPTSFVYPDWALELIPAGFAHWEAFAFTTVLHYTPAAWRGRMRASYRVAPSMRPATLARFDTAFEHLLAERFPGELLAAEHSVFGIVASA